MIENSPTAPCIVSTSPMVKDTKMIKKTRIKKTIKNYILSLNPEKWLRSIYIEHSIRNRSTKSITKLKVNASLTKILKPSRF